MSGRSRIDNERTRRSFLQETAAAGGALALASLSAEQPAAAQTPAAAPPQSRARKLRDLLQRPGLVTVPEAYTVIAGKLAEAHGFDAVYIGGNMMSMTYLGVPDWGVITTTDMAEIAGRIAREISIPAIVDADQAGETSLNAYRTVQLYQQAGVAGLHIEDSVNPKKMETWAGPGGPTTTPLQPLPYMEERLRAAVAARTDPDFVIIGRTVAETPGGVIERGNAFARAGADVVMNSLSNFSAEQINAIAGALPVPLLGIAVPKTHLPGTRMKVNIHPNIVSSAALALCNDMFRELRQNGETTRAPIPTEMLVRLTGADTFSDLARRWLTLP